MHAGSCPTPTSKANLSWKLNPKQKLKIIWKMLNILNQKVMKVTVITVKTVFRRVMITVLIAVIMLKTMVLTMRVVITAQKLQVRKIELQPVVAGK